MNRSPASTAAECSAQPGPGGEPGTVEEDAGAVDEAGDRLAVLVGLGDAAALVGDALVLPLLVGQPLGDRLDPGQVGVVAEVGAVGAAALLQLGRLLGEHALAPPAEDARPRRGEERQVEDPGALLVGVLERHPLVQVFRTGHRPTLPSLPPASATTTAAKWVGNVPPTRHQANPLRGPTKWVGNGHPRVTANPLRRGPEWGGGRVSRRRRRGRRVREEVDGLLDRSSGTGEALLVDGELVASGVDRLAEPDDRQVGELLGDALQPRADVVELTSHGGSLASGSDRLRRPSPLRR